MVKQAVINNLDSLFVSKLFLNEIDFNLKIIMIVTIVRKRIVYNMLLKFLKNKNYIKKKALFFVKIIYKSSFHLNIPTHARVTWGEYFFPI